MKIILETDRIILRPWKHSDISDYHKMMDNPLVLKYLPIDHFTLEDAETKIQSRIDQQNDHGFCIWAMVLKENNKLIGHCGLQYICETKDIEVGYALSPDQWNRGLATEAAKASLDYGFKTLRLGIILGLVFPDNKSSKHILKKIGMKYVGITGKYYNANEMLLYELTSAL
ncbi:MAG: GNAT family N-acetyltransferase [Proteobacteria bacterium]|nr:GNAT family N-acetyltransferase [Pseudomonadota bacterium]